MEATQASPLVMDLRAIFDRATLDRVPLLTEYLGRLHTGELAVAFPLVLDNIFGTAPDATSASRRGWNLDLYGRENDPYAHRVVLDFLRPSGPLMTAALRLKSEVSIKFPFPFSRLPDGYKVQVAHGELSPFLAERFESKGPSELNGNSVLVLDAVELLFFQLAAYAVNPERPGALVTPAYAECYTGQRGGFSPPLPWVTASASASECLTGSVYIYLIDTYFEHFFSSAENDGGPAGGCAESPSSSSYSAAAAARTPFAARMAHQLQRASSPAERYFSPLIKMSALLDASGVDAGSPAAVNGGGSRFADSTSRFEGARRAQLFLSVVCHLWMALPPHLPGPASSPSLVAASGRRWPAPSSPRLDGAQLHPAASPQQSFEGHGHQHSSYPAAAAAADAPFVLPSPDLAALIRVVVKHVHFYLNKLGPSQGTAQVEAIKKSLLETLRRGLYPLLKQLFLRWPLDHSFRMILELWLSFIQPWRYVEADGNEGRNRRTAANDVGDVWEGFIAAHYPFYSVLFLSVIWRCVRLDLDSPRLSVVLTRTVKIFGTPNLARILRKLDAELDQAVAYRKSGVPTASLIAGPPYGAASAAASPSQSSFRHFHGAQTGLTFSTPLRVPSRLDACGSRVVASMLELEGPEGQWDQTLFSRHAIDLVVDLMQNIRMTQQNLELQVKVRELEARKSDFIHDALESCTTVKQRVSYYAAASWKKLVAAVVQGLRGDASKPSKTMQNGAEEPNAAELPEKRVANLESAVVFLEDFFDVAAPGKLELPEVTEDTLQESKLTGTPISPASLRNRAVHRHVGIEADETGMFKATDLPWSNPDRHTPRTSEVAWIVLMLMDLSDWINSMIGDNVMAVYNDRGLLGRFGRAFISPPLPYYECEKVGLGKLRKTLTILPPRIRLRPLGESLWVLIAAVVAVLTTFNLFPLDLSVLLSWILASMCVYAVGYAAYEAAFAGLPDVYVPSNVGAVGAGAGASRRLNGGARFDSSDGDEMHHHDDG